MRMLNCLDSATDPNYSFYLENTPLQKGIGVQENAEFLDY